jgi:radical SAM/Cys-rich protein
MRATLPLLEETDFPPITRTDLVTLQVNLGYRCNQSCQHCHVNAGPNRKEEMSAENLAGVLAFLAANPGVTTLDLTGGAPELHPGFRGLVAAARARRLRVIDRCNLTILNESRQEELAAFLAEQGVEIVASMPCYLEENVDHQRGKGVFQGSIQGLRRLNAQGYGEPGTDLVLDLVYNPLGPSLPPPQQGLEADYRTHLGERYGIRFNRLLTIANMPVQRFGSTLISQGQLADYMRLLRDAHCNGNLDQVMCRSLLSVDWQGYLYDCDFNQQLGLPIPRRGRPRTHLSEVTAASLRDQPVRVANHCYGCTAGQGSSCGGALTGGAA